MARFEPRTPERYAGDYIDCRNQDELLRHLRIACFSLCVRGDIAIYAGLVELTCLAEMNTAAGVCVFFKSDKSKKNLKSETSRRKKNATRTFLERKICHEERKEIGLSDLDRRSRFIRFRPGGSSRSSI